MTATVSPSLKGILGGKFHVRLLAVFHRYDVDTVDPAQIQLPHAFAQHTATHGNAPHLDAVPQCNVVQIPEISRLPMRTAISASG